MLLTPPPDPLQFPYSSLRGLAMLRIQLFGSFQDQRRREAIDSLAIRSVAGAVGVSRAASRSTPSPASNWRSPSGPIPPMRRPAPISAPCSRACVKHCPTPINFWRLMLRPCNGAATAPFTIDVIEFEQALAANRLNRRRGVVSWRFAARLLRRLDHGRARALAPSVSTRARTVDRSSGAATPL